MQGSHHGPQLQIPRSPCGISYVGGVFLHPGCRAVANAMCATQGLGQKDASLTGILDSPEQSPPTSGTHFGSMISLSTCKGCKPGSCEVLKIHLVRLHGMWSIGNLNFRTSSLVLSWDGDSASRDWCCSVNMEETAQHPSTRQKLSDDLAKPPSCKIINATTSRNCILTPLHRLSQ